jgi:hypothetical protein
MMPQVAFLRYLSAVLRYITERGISVTNARMRVRNIRRLSVIPSSMVASPVVSWMNHTTTSADALPDELLNLSINQALTFCASCERILYVEW